MVNLSILKNKLFTGNEEKLSHILSMVNGQNGANNLQIYIFLLSGFA